MLLHMYIVHVTRFQNLFNASASGKCYQMSKMLENFSLLVKPLNTDHERAL